MSFSLSEQSQDRKARLAALRNKHKQPTTEPEQEQLSLTTTELHTSDEPPTKKPQLKSRNFNFATNTQTKAIDNLLDTVNKVEEAKDTETSSSLQDQIDNTPPKLIISSTETLEAITTKLQSEIMSQIQTKYQIKKKTPEQNDMTTKTRKISDDLIRDIKEDMEILDERYELCLKKIMRDRVRSLQAKAESSQV